MSPSNGSPAQTFKKRMRDRISGRHSSDSPPLIRAERDCTISIEGSSSGRSSRAAIVRRRQSAQNVQRRRSADVAPLNGVGGDCASTSSELSNEDDLIHTKYPIVNKMGREVKWFMLDVIDAFERKEVDTIETEEGEQIQFFDDKAKLSVVQLRKDLKRLFAATQPLLEAAAAGYDLLLWKNPIATLLLVLVYMYSIFVGYFWALTFQLILLQLALNYSKYQRNVDVGLVFLPRKEVKMPKLDMSSGQLIIDLAKVAQQLVKFAADLMEKFESLFLWKRPEITFHFTCLVVYWLAWSMFFSIGTCFGACAMTFGIRLFLTTYLFDRFPRLRYRLDTYGYFYRNLPVKSGTMERPIATDGRFFPSAAVSGIAVSPTSENGGGTGTDSTGSGQPQQQMPGGAPRRSHSMDHVGLLSSSFDGSHFNLSDDADNDSIEEEDLTEGVIEHRKCVMAEKASRTNSSGTLHLTHQSLHFRSLSGDEERMIMLDELLTVKQVTSVLSLSFLTGARKGIDIECEDEDGSRQKTSFYSISKRDDLVDAIERVCRERRTRTNFIRQ